jgi:hypothetical protein
MTKKKKPDLTEIFSEDIDDEEIEESPAEEEDDFDDDFEDEEEELVDSEEEDSDEEDSDEDEEVEPPPAKTKKRENSRKRVVEPKAKKKKSKPKGSLTLDMSVLEGTAVRVAPKGTVDSRFPINPYKASKGRKDRIAILDERPIIAKTHYVKGYGYFHCFGGACCEDGFASTRYIFPIVRYDTSGKGKVVSSDYEIQFLNLPPRKYDGQIIPRVEDEEDITAQDIRITCTDSDKQDFQMSPISKLYWKTEKFDSKQIIEDAQKLVKHIPASVAKRITEAQYETDVKGKVPAGVEEDEDYDDLDDL